MAGEGHSVEKGAKMNEFEKFIQLTDG